MLAEAGSRAACFAFELGLDGLVAAFHEEFEAGCKDATFPGRAGGGGGILKGVAVVKAALEIGEGFSFLFEDGGLKNFSELIDLAGNRLRLEVFGEEVSEELVVLFLNLWNGN